MNKEPFRNARYYYAAVMYRLKLGMSLTSQAKNILAMPVYIGMFNMTILNPLGHNIPAEYMLYLIPVMPIFVMIAAHFNLKLGINQAEQDYAQRRTSPFQQEMRGRIKNIERYLATRFNGKFREDWKWTEEDNKGGF